VVKNGGILGENGRILGEIVQCAQKQGKNSKNLWEQLWRFRGEIIFSMCYNSATTREQMFDKI